MYNDRTMLSLPFLSTDGKYSKAISEEDVILQFRITIWTEWDVCSQRQQRKNVKH